LLWPRCVSADLCAHFLIAEICDRPTDLTRKSFPLAQMVSISGPSWLVRAATGEKPPIDFVRARLIVSMTAGSGGLMTQAEVKKSSRAIAEEAFHVKLGPMPAFPPEPGEDQPSQADGEVMHRSVQSAAR
jgi:hypothetical protein